MSFKFEKIAQWVTSSGWVLWITNRWLSAMNYKQKITGTSHRSSCHQAGYLWILFGSTQCPHCFRLPKLNWLVKFGKVPRKFTTKMIFQKFKKKTPTWLKCLEFKCGCSTLILRVKFVLAELNILQHTTFGPSLTFYNVNIFKHFISFYHNNTMSKLSISVLHQKINLSYPYYVEYP